MKPYPKLFPGDIFGVKGGGIAGWLCRHLITPSTDRFHFGLVGDYLPWDDDYVILESIGKGIAVGRLSFYNPEDIEIYRVNLSRDPRLRIVNMLLRRQVAAELTKVGRARYDWILIAQLVVGALRLLATGNLPPWKPEQFPYGINNKYVCTEAGNYGWRAKGHPIIKAGVVPLPAGYKQALIERRMRKIFPEK